MTMADYTGGTKEGMRHGAGREKYSDGSVYEGNWSCDKKHGRGVYAYGGRSNKGDVYEGSFYEDKRQGHGVLRYASGSVFDGVWINDKQHGPG